MNLENITSVFVSIQCAKCIVRLVVPHMPETIFKHFAHSLPGRPHEEWHDLEKHLTDTAERAEAFADSFAAGWGRLAGWWHDSGKYRRAFQARIGAGDADAHVNERVDHSSIGAL